MAKKREYLFTIKFNPSVPGHAEAAAYLNSIGRTKADMIARTLVSAGFTAAEGVEVRPVEAPRHKSLEPIKVQEPADITIESVDTTPAEPEVLVQAEEPDTVDEGGIPDEFHDMLMANLHYFDAMEAEDEE